MSFGAKLLEAKKKKSFQVFRDFLEKDYEWISKATTHQSTKTFLKNIQLIHLLEMEKQSTKI